MAKIGSILKKNRTNDKIGCTLTELAFRTGLSQPYLSMVENNKKTPTSETLFKIVEELAKKGEPEEQITDTLDKFYSFLYWVETIFSEILENIGFTDVNGLFHPNKDLNSNEIDIFNNIISYLDKIEAGVSILPTEFIDNMASGYKIENQEVSLDKFIFDLENDVTDKPQKREFVTRYVNEKDEEFIFSGEPIDEHGVFDLNSIIQNRYFLNHIDTNGLSSIGNATPLYYCGIELDPQDRIKVMKILDAVFDINREEYNKKIK